MDIRLRKVTEHDTYLLVKWRNENAEFFPPQEPLTVLSHRTWYFNTYLYHPEDNYFLVLADHTPVGTIAINSFSGEIGRVLLGNKRFERQGVMSEALDLLMDSFNLGWYWLRVLRNNEAAIAFYKRNYFMPFTNNYGPDGDGDFVCMERDNS